MTGKQSFFITLSLGIVLGVGLTLNPPAIAKKTTGSNIDLPFEEIDDLTHIYELVRQQYIDEVPDKELLENAFRGMLSGLDPHSTYMSQDEYKDFQVSISGKFGGLGIQVTMEDGLVKVISPIDDTPADKAGMKSGDFIIKLDERPVRGMTLSEAVDIMRGDPGTDIDLTVIRKGADSPFPVKITRDEIKVQSVKTKVLDSNYGYLRISSFQQESGADAKKALKKLKKNNDLKGLVIDLRNNPGGSLKEAVLISDLFLDSGMIVSIKYRADKDEHHARSGDIMDGDPIVVLINEGSASASEIVAGALQDHSRAVIMGRKSFGKGSVQTVLPLPNQNAIKLTTARYYTPLDRSIQAEGIEPDITLSRVKVEALESNGVEPYKEANLSGHLESENTSKDDAEEDEPEDNLAERDFGLYEALNLLKGLSILQAKK